MYQKNSNAFALLEVTLGLMVLGVILLVCSKMLLYIHKDNIEHSHRLNFELQMRNTLDALGAYLVEASRDSIIYGGNFISWEDGFFAPTPSSPAPSSTPSKITAQPSNPAVNAPNAQELPNPPAKSHTITLNQGSLYLDGFLMMEGVDRFEIFRTGSGFEITLCGKINKKPLCEYKIIRLLEV